MGLLGTLLDIGCVFDWITPATSLVTTRKEDRFVVPEQYFNMVDGIGKNMQIINGMCVFDARKKGDGDNIEKYLRMMGIPF